MPTKTSLKDFLRPRWILLTAEAAGQASGRGADLAAKVAHHKRLKDHKRSKMAGS
jgi:hypothetical protein